MYDLRITSIDRDVNDLIKEFKSLDEKITQQIKEVANEGRNKMRNVIETERKRDKEPTTKPHLSDLIDTEIVTNTDDEIAVGVGNIETIESKHGQGWKLLNWGGKVPAGGKFVPGEFTDGPPKVEGGRARFIYQKGSKTGMKPKKVVTGIHFIEKALTWVSMKWDEMVGRL